METSVQHLIQGGAVGISVALILLVYKIMVYCNKNSERVTDVVAKNAEALTQLKDSININTTATENMSEGLKGISEVARDAMKLKRRTKL